MIYAESADQAVLVRQLRAYSRLSKKEAQRIASQTFGGGPLAPVPIVPRSDWPSVGKHEHRVIAYRIRRIERAVNRAFPLLEGEQLQGDGVFTSYLAKDYIHYPQGTAVVRRRTNFGELVFLDPRFRIREAAILDLGVPSPLLVAPSELAAFNWGELAGNIGKSLAGSIASKIGSAIFDALFPPGVPSYFDEVYEEFTKIVEGVINETKRRELSGRVNAVQDGMITYNTLKKDPAKYAESQQILSTVWNDSRYVTNELKEFPEIGLGLFVIAGGLHLAIVQEKALTDRDHANPNDSPWAEDLIRKVNEFAPWAIDNRNRIINTRSAAISEVRFVQHSTYVPPAGPVDDSYWFWEDTWTGERFKYPVNGGCCSSDPEGTARAERQARWDATVGVMTSELAPVIPTAEDWKKVGANPIPF